MENFCIIIHQGYWPVVFFSSSVFLLKPDLSQLLKFQVGGLPEKYKDKPGTIFIMVN